MKLGDTELEPKRTNTSASTLEARMVFMKLIPSLGPGAVYDLLRLYNQEYLSDGLDELAVEICGSIMARITEPRRLDRELKKRNIDTSVGNTPVLLLSKFLESNGQFQQFVDESREELGVHSSSSSDAVVYQMAIKKLIPTWASLEGQNESAELIESVVNWAKKYGLNEGWCLDFALHALTAFRFHLSNNKPFAEKVVSDPTMTTAFRINYPNWVNEAWQGAIREVQHERVVDLLVALSEIPDLEPFKFRWLSNLSDGSVEFEITKYYAPYSISSEKFGEEIERELWGKFFDSPSNNPGSLVGRLDEVISNLDRFRVARKEFIKRSNRGQSKRGRPVVKKESDDLHFKWLVEYQVNGKSYKEVAIKYSRDSRTVREGVKSVAELISLSRRKPTNSGRRRGIKESHTRRVARR